MQNNNFFFIPEAKVEWYYEGACPFIKSINAYLNSTTAGAIAKTLEAFLGEASRYPNDFRVTFDYEEANWVYDDDTGNEYCEYITDNADFGICKCHVAEVGTDNLVVVARKISGDETRFYVPSGSVIEFDYQSSCCQIHRLGYFKGNDIKFDYVAQR
jgi:hypothetical protein